MDKAIEGAMANKPFILGVLCADNNGLTVLEKGELVGAPAGRYVSISRIANSLSNDTSPATILIETVNKNVIVKDYDSMVIALSCAQ